MRICIKLRIFQQPRTAHFFDGMRVQNLAVTQRKNFQRIPHTGAICADRESPSHW